MRKTVFISFLFLFLVQHGNAITKQNDQDCSVLASIPYWDQPDAIKSFRTNIDHINYISVFWYNIGPDGKIRKYVYAKEDKSLVKFAHKNGVKVFALIANLPDDERETNVFEWDSVRVGHMLNSESSRRSHIVDLLKLTRRMNYDGILVDYEALPGKYRKVYSSFIKELARELHRDKKLLAIAIHPKTSEHNPRENNGSHSQDWDALKKHADQMHFMTYGEHTSSSTPGPIASPGWLQRILNYAVNQKHVSHEKIFVGVPLYGEVWERKNKGKYKGLKLDLTFSGIEYLKQKYSVQQRWSEKYSSPYMQYRIKNGTTRLIWFENLKSFSAKQTVWQKYNLCNLALWRLGNEDPAVWMRLRELGYGRK